MLNQSNSATEGRDDYYRRPKAKASPKPVPIGAIDPVEILGTVYEGIPWDEINDDTQFIALAVLSGEVCASCNISYRLRPDPECQNVRHIVGLRFNKP